MVSRPEKGHCVQKRVAKAASCLSSALVLLLRRLILLLLILLLLFLLLSHPLILHKRVANAAALGISKLCDFNFWAENFHIFTHIP